MTSPVCDATARTCRGCATDGEGASQICDETAGLCIAESVVLYAAPNGSSTSACSQLAPCSIERAFAVSDNTRNTIKLTAGVYDASITVANKRISVVASGATISSSSASTLTVHDNASLTVEGGTIVNSATSALGAVVARSTNNVDVPELVLRDSTVQSLKLGFTSRRRR